LQKYCIYSVRDIFIEYRYNIKIIPYNAKLVKIYNACTLAFTGLF